MDRDSKVWCDFVVTQRALVLERQGTARATLRRLLVDLGFKSGAIDVTDNLEDAVEVFSLHRPRIVFADHVFGGKSGFELLRLVKDQYPNRLNTTLFMSAETKGPYLLNRIEDEEIDAFIERPFTYNSLRELVEEVLFSKLVASPYEQYIAEAKMLISKKQYQDAIPELIRAKLANRKAKEAWVLEGRIYQAQKHLEDALACFERACEIDSSFYPAVAGKFDLLVATGKWADADDISQNLLSFFSLRPKKLPDLIRFSVHQKRYDEIIAYYDMFIRLDESDDEIAQAICAAMILAGKHFVTQGRTEVGINCLRKAAQMSNTRPSFIKEIVVFLLNLNLENEARTTIAGAPDEVKESDEVKLAELDYFERTGKVDSARLAAIAHDLIREGVSSPLLYETLIRNSLAMGRRTTILKEILEEAVRRFPERRKAFEALASKKAG